MRGIDPRVVEVTAAFPPVTSWASGYRVSGNLILTARHVVAAEGTLAQAYAVRPLGSSEFVPATVAWLSAALDLAVLSVAPGALPAIHAGSAPRWGRLEGRQSVSCRFTGFPVAHRRTGECGRQVRDPEPVEGTLKLATAAKREVVDIAIAGSVPNAATAGSLWQGMSGAAVLCGPWLVGVITSDPENFGPDRLSATLIETALAEPSLLALFAKENASTRLELADLPWALQAPYRGPASSSAEAHPGRSRVRLLQPEFGIVPFVGREAELSDLAQWCAREDRVSAQLLTGPGGQGKTRLALELCRQQEAAGWLCGVLADHTEIVDLDTLLAASAPLLVVVDWADVKTGQVVAFVQRAVASAAGPVRLLLAARRAGEWWASLPYHVQGEAQDVFFASGTLALSTAADTLAAQREQFSTAAHAFANHLGRAWGDVPEPDLSDRLFETLLFVHLAALVAVEPSPIGPSGDQISSDLLTEILRREDVYYWEPGAPASLRGETARTTRQRAVAVATLTAAQTEDEARQALQTLPDFAQADPTAALYWLHDLYPAKAYLGPLRPDRLGEALVAQVVRARTDLPLHLVPDAERRWVTRLLTVLAQAAGTEVALIDPLQEALTARLGQLAEKAQSASDASLGHALALALRRTGSVESASALVGQLPDSSLAIAELAVASYQVLLAHDFPPEQRLALLGNLARWLVEIGQYDEAVDAAQDGVAIGRGIAAEHEEYRVALAMELAILASALNQVERYEEGLRTADEAIAILRLEPETPPQVFHFLALTLTIRQVSLISLGREREGMDALDEAVVVLRRLAEDNNAYRPSLAQVLVRLSDMRARWNDRKESKAAILEALGIYRELAGSNPDAYRMRLAEYLVTASQLLLNYEMGAEASALAQEAMPLCRELADINADQCRPLLARALDTQADCLMAVQRPADALPVRKETVAVYRDLVQGGNARTYAPLLAMALTRKAECLNTLGRTEEALAATDEAIAVFRHAEATGEEAIPNFAAALASRSRLLTELNQTAGALDAIEEAVKIYRILVAQLPQRYYAELTNTLREQSQLLVGVGRDAEALTAVEKATELPRSLASAQPRAFWALSKALLEKADQLERAGRSEEAESAREEAHHLPGPQGMMIYLPEIPLPDGSVVPGVWRPLGGE
jgi:tetratricopeptide (TPR) repeat protein